MNAFIACQLIIILIMQQMLPGIDVKSKSLEGEPLAHLRPPGSRSSQYPSNLVALKVLSAEAESRGLIRPLLRATRNVTFANQISFPVSLEINSKSCGCLNASFSKVLVEPGQQTVLTLSATVTPAFGEQTQSATFSAKWIDTSGPQSERGICLLSYFSDIEVLVRPEQATLKAIEGTNVSVDLFIRATDGSDAAPPTPKCTLTNWKVRRVNDAALRKGTWHFIAEGICGSGRQSGEILVRPSSEVHAAITVPLTVVGICAVIAKPAAVVFSMAQANDADSSKIMLLDRVTNMPLGRPFTVSSDSKWVTVVHSAGDELIVQFKPDSSTRIAGAATLAVRDDSGRALLQIPVAWFLDGWLDAPIVHDPVADPLK